MSDLPEGYDLDHRREPVGDEFLRIVLSSNTSLTELASQDGSNLDGVYVDADFCPMQNPDQIITFDPTTDDGRSLHLLSDAEPQRAASDGRYRIVVYLKPSNGQRRSVVHGDPPHPEYSLPDTERDVCLRLFAPGYNLIKSRSNTVEVSADAIREALRRRE